MSTFDDTGRRIYSDLFTECHLEGLKKELQLREQIVLLIQRTELWELVQQVCSGFHERYLQEGNDQDLLLGPLVLPLYIGYAPLRKFDEKLLTNIIQEPILYERIFREVILSIANTFFSRLEPPFRIRLEQVYCRLRLKLPLEEQYLFRTHPQNVSIGLTVLHGVVQAFSSGQKYILQSVWVCPDDPYSVTITGEVKRVPKCDDCGCPQQEHQRIRAVSDFCTVRVFDVDSLRTPTTVGRIFQSISVRLADDLSQQLRLGYEYAFTGVFNSLSQLFNAWQVEKL
ncbi:uncharacterized protein LOC129716567 [Wyeomyia smithii]|uniref:uncharacterized protein LOC129716567 n=1 Tax=Wyeomyia smithii TaxID=174621 RepID=UPI002467D8E7|nr:uncharacterized protein LOC129716567 [Wyeomyia smithii]